MQRYLPAYHLHYRQRLILFWMERQWLFKMVSHFISKNYKKDFAKRMLLNKSLPKFPWDMWYMILCILMESVQLESRLEKEKRFYQTYLLKSQLLTQALKL